MGTFFQAFCQADTFGKLIFFGLFALSLISWSFLLRKIWDFRQLKQNMGAFDTLYKKQRESLLQLSLEGATSHPFAQLFKTLKETTLAVLKKNHTHSRAQETYLSRNDIDLLESHLQTAIGKEREKLEKNLFILSTTATLAPFLGLLGTVWGILITFDELQAGHSVTSNAVILGGLSTALTTTVLGLLIAIPALIAYNYLKNRSRYFSLEMRDFSHHLLSTVELQYRKVDVL